MMPQPVTAGEHLAGIGPITPEVVAEILDGGQCFRWNRSADGSWRGVSGTVAATLRETPGGLAVDVTSGDARELAHHLGADVDWDALADQLPWRTDAHLARCVRAFPGLRILRQPFGETLLCFLCSATKQIVQIKQMTELLAARCGRELAPGCQALPTWCDLATVSEADLRACKLGFRARNVAAIAQRLDDRPDWLDETAALPYAEARTRLISLPGVGEKIADCVLLFGAARLEAFPVDVWILRAMERHYGLVGWRPDQIAHFGRVHFGPLAGFAQQFLFAWERRHGAAATRAAGI